MFASACVPVVPGLATGLRFDDSAKLPEWTVCISENDVIYKASAARVLETGQTAVVVALTEDAETDVHLDSATIIGAQVREHFGQRDVREVGITALSAT